MDTLALVTPMRLSLSLSVAAFAWGTWRALTPAADPPDSPARGAPEAWHRRLGLRLLGLFALAELVTQQGLVARLPRVFQLGMALAMGVTLASVAGPEARARFDAMPAERERGLLGFRMVFGAFLYAAAFSGVLPPRFGLLAGTGDLLVGWLAWALPETRRARRAVHIVGLVDLASVLAGVALDVLPWVARHAEVRPAVSLPWVAVPLMLAINLHGIRRGLAVAAARPTAARA